MFNSGWNFNNSTENEKRLGPFCQQVESYFKFPDRRLSRYFAIEDGGELEFLASEFPPGFGKYYRGFHMPFSGIMDLPICLRRCYFQLDCDDDFLEFIMPQTSRAFDDLVFIRESTCNDEPVGFVTTYAHELQHFVQYGPYPKLGYINNALYSELRKFEPNAIATDVPSERDANIVSKRVAEAICGTKVVRAFAEEQISLMDAASKIGLRRRWEFFRDVSSSENYNFFEATLLRVEQYKDRINFGMDVNKPKWWEGPLEI